jgi:hypothetical protein
MTGLPDYSSNINVDKKTIPYLRYMPTKESFVGNDQENKQIKLNIDLDTKVAFDFNAMKSGWRWFKGDGSPPEKHHDAWVNGKCTQAPQPGAQTNAKGELKSFTRFVEIPAFNSTLGTRLMNFDGAGTYKSAQFLVGTWQEKRSNQNDTVFVFKFKGIKHEVSTRDKTRNIAIPQFEFDSEISRPAQFENMGIDTQKTQSADIPF